jgi:hypothetical protein
MDPDRAKKILYGAALAGLAGLGIVLIIVFATGGNSKGGSPRRSGDDGGCRLLSRSRGGALDATSRRSPIGHGDLLRSAGAIYIPAICRTTRSSTWRQVRNTAVSTSGSARVSAAERQKISDFYDSN